VDRFAQPFSLITLSYTILLC